MGEITAQNTLTEIINKLLLLHLVGCLHYCINDARSRKYQIPNAAIACEVILPHTVLITFPYGDIFLMGI